MYIGTPPPQDVIFGKSTYLLGGGGCDKNYLKASSNNLFTPSYGRMVDF